jgi:hypothetical protein
MGVRRNVLVGPGESLGDLTIDVNIPLDTGVKIVLGDAPGLGAAGPDQYRVNALIDLGGEGVIRLPGGRAVWSGDRSTIMTGLAPLVQSISDASYSIVAGAYTQTTSAPYSVRVVRGVRDLSRPVTIDGFLGVTRFTDPAPDGTTTVRHLSLTPDGGSATPTLYYHILIKTDGTPTWHVLARGDLTDVPLYDLSALGLPQMTTDKLIWTVYGITLPGESFDTFNYGKLNVNRWSAYTYAYATVAFLRP